MSASSEQAFLEHFGDDPAVVVRSPGRVNLIGEHTDYSGLPVLPIAVQRSIRLALGPGDGAVQALSTSQPERYRIALPLADATEVAGWGRYLVGVLRVLAREGYRCEAGARLMVSGDLPQGGGLSSSSALSVGLLSGLDALLDLGLEPDLLVDLAVRAEREVGVETGGMDQTVIAFARAGHALRIDFTPPERRIVPVPDDARFVVAFSGESAPKGGAARDAYNLRVVGCRAAAALLGRALGVEPGRPPRLADVAPVAHALAAAGALPASASAREVAQRCGIESSALRGFTVGALAEDVALPVRACAEHVLAEAARVDAAEVALEAADRPALGVLMDASHESLRAFGAATPALDRLVASLREAGADGARLTGAGFGGYAVAVCAPERVPAVVEAGLGHAGGPAFEVVPSDGARRISGSRPG